MRVQTPSFRVVAAAVWLSLLATALWIVPVDGDDAYAHSVMAVEQLKCWRHGVVWPRFHPDWNGGTGSFLPSIYSPVVLTVDGLLVMVTQEGSRAVSISLVLALLSMAILLQRTARETPVPWWLALVAPYVLLNIFARATATEMWALAGVAGVLPVALSPDAPAGWRWPSAVAAGLLMVGSQPIMLIVLAVPLAVTWLDGWRVKDRSDARDTLLLVVLIAVSSGVFWFPPAALIGNFDQATIFRGAYGWKGHFATSLGGNGELGPPLLAIWLVLVVIVVTATYVSRGTMDSRFRKQLVFAGACLFLASPASAPIWMLPGLGLVQFPWRFLGPATVVVLLVLGRLPSSLRRGLMVLFVLPLFLIPVTVTVALPRLAPVESRHELERTCAIRYGLAPILPLTPGEYARGFHPLKSLQKLLTQDAEVRRASGGCRFPHIFVVEAKESGTVLFPLQWWPRLIVREGERRLAYENVDGLVGVRLARGSHRIGVSIGPCWSRWIGAGITAVGLLTCAVLWMVGWRPWRRSGPQLGQGPS